MTKILVRQSQIAHTYATGSIGDFPGVSVMFLSHDHEKFDWGKLGSGDKVNDRRIIKDKRLTEAFGIENFVLPPVEGLGSNSLKVVRFPMSLYCPSCGRIHFVPDLEKFNNGYIPRNKSGLMTFDNALKAYYCTDCIQNNPPQTIELVPTRFIIANLEGFIDDFPWDWYVHRKPEKRKERKKGHKLYLEFKSSSASLGSINLISKDKNGKIISIENLSEIFDQDKTFIVKDDEYLSYVKNRMSKPWLGRDGDEFIKETIDAPRPDQISRESDGRVSGGNAEIVRRKYPRTLQRGANNLFFPLVFKGIRLPEGDNNFDQQLVSQITFLKKTFSENQPDIYNDYSNEQWIQTFRTPPLRALLKCDDESLAVILQFLFPLTDGEENSTEKKQKLRMEEFNCFSNSDIRNSDKIWYKARHIKLSDGFLKNKVKIDGITLLDKINELKIFRGFTRIKPLANEDLIFETNNTNLDRLDEYNRICDARKYLVETNELPCAEVKGEGIFLRFDNDVLTSWERKDTVLMRFSQMKNNLANYFGTFNIDNGLEKISARYVLLHTLSHILMQQLASDSGYNLSSLTEIIYCNYPKSKEEMNGILIYTSSSDTEGTLGGLVEKGEENRLALIISKAIDKAKWCSSDPLCITSEGQGFMATNMAACYSCVMVPETCCENLNKFLDRKLLLDFFDIETL